MSEKKRLVEWIRDLLGKKLPEMESLPEVPDDQVVSSLIDRASGEDAPEARKGAPPKEGKDVPEERKEAPPKEGKDVPEERKEAPPKEGKDVPEAHKEAPPKEGKDAPEAHKGDSENPKESKEPPAEAKEGKGGCSFAIRRNIVASLQEIRRFAEENNLAGTMIRALLTLLAEMAIGALRGKVSASILDALLKIISFENAVADAYSQGEKAGRNAGIEREFFPNGEDGLPHFTGTELPRLRTPDIFTLATKA